MTYPDHRNKRNRNRPPRGIVSRSEWVYKGRAVIVVEVTQCGAPLITVRDASRVDPAAKEAGAWWLNQLLPRLDHESCYAMLWTREGKG